MAQPPLHPAQNRALRELYAATQQLARRWPALASSLAGTGVSGPLTEGAGTAAALLGELPGVTNPRDLHGGPAARGVGTAAATIRGGVRDRFLERNQAARVALLDLQHVVTLIAYIGATAESRGDEALASFCRRWEERMRAVEDDVRTAVVALGSDPDAAIEPLDTSAGGRAAHRAAYAVGALGEWFDRRTARRDG